MTTIYDVFRQINPHFFRVVGYLDCGSTYRSRSNCSTCLARRRMLIRRWRRGLLFPAAMDLDQPLKFMCALAALFYSAFWHCSSSAIPYIISSHSLCNAQCALSGWACQE